MKSARERASATSFLSPAIWRTLSWRSPSMRMSTADLRIQLYSGSDLRELNIETVTELSVKIIILLPEGNRRLASSRADRTARAS